MTDSEKQTADAFKKLRKALLLHSVIGIALLAIIDILLILILILR